MAFNTDSGDGPMSDINVTPLVDVMLVLLIIFIITAPMMSHKVQIDLPQANLNRQDEESDAPKPFPITVAVREDGSIFWNDDPITREMLESRLSSAAQQVPQPPLNLRGDRSTRMRTINEVIQIAQSQGMLDIGFVTTKEQRQ